MERTEVIEGLRRALASEERIVAVYLYGSRARGDVREGSDVDVGVLYDSEPTRVLDGPVAALESRLEAAVGVPVGVVSLRGSPPDLVHRVLRDGVIVYESDRARRIRFEVRARNEYFDLKPFLDRYRSAPAARG